MQQSFETSDLVPRIPLSHQAKAATPTLCVSPVFHASPALSSQHALVSRPSPPSFTSTPPSSIHSFGTFNSPAQNTLDSMLSKNGALTHDMLTGSYSALNRYSSPRDPYLQSQPASGRQSAASSEWAVSDRTEGQIEVATNDYFGSTSGLPFLAKQRSIREASAGQGPSSLPDSLRALVRQDEDSIDSAFLYHTLREPGDTLAISGHEVLPPDTLVPYEYVDKLFTIFFQVCGAFRL